MVTKWGGANEDMLGRIGKARYAYHKLKKVWNSSVYRRKTKMKIFESNVISVLLYGCESWKMNEYNEKNRHICSKMPTKNPENILPQHDLK